MDLTGKTKRYFRKRLAQKGLLNNSESRAVKDYPPTMQSVMNKMGNNGSASFYQVS